MPWAEQGMAVRFRVWVSLQSREDAFFLLKQVSTWIRAHPIILGSLPKKFDGSSIPSRSILCMVHYPEWGEQLFSVVQCCSWFSVVHCLQMQHELAKYCYMFCSVSLCYRVEPYVTMYPCGFLWCVPWLGLNSMQDLGVEEMWNWIGKPTEERNLKEI